MTFEEFNELSKLAAEIVEKNSKEGLTAEVKALISKYYYLEKQYGRQSA